MSVQGQCGCMDHVNNLIWTAALNVEHLIQSFVNHGPMYRPTKVFSGETPQPPNYQDMETRLQSLFEPQVDVKSDDEEKKDPAPALHNISPMSPDFLMTDGLVSNTPEFVLSNIPSTPSKPLDVALFLVAHLDRVLKHRRISTADENVLIYLAHKIENIQNELEWVSTSF
eukprot:TRINITY_DN7463_c0_g1_i1.p1 TRINITY_DN7463_c0_g1~~TRINITY_DN7463_c0_g1_i1.p1  ORF type:complete len:170 (-),score=30.07 TRINITY_DN7463_c0_g1_i1:13-522(-)